MYEDKKNRRKPPQLEISEYGSENVNESQRVSNKMSESYYEGRRNSEVLMPSNEIKASRTNYKTTNTV